jgi:GT2 family glycosyltransferase
MDTKMSNHKIAVLMPVYNPGEELTETLNSLRAQTVPFRLFLVDDGSQKKPDYAALTRNMDCQLILLAVNAGVTGALNAGLAEILKHDFQFIARIDNGDICLPKRFEKQLAFLKQRPDVSIAGSWVEMVFTETGARHVVRFPSGLDECKRAMWSNMPVSHPALIIRTSLFRQIGVYSDDYHAAEDYDLVRRAADAGLGVDNVQELLLRKIETSDSISARKRTTQLKSRLGIQWAHRKLTSPKCLAGLAKTIALLVMPASLTRSLKTAIGR